MRTRQTFDPKVREEIARGWYYRTLTSKEIEARGIQMGNVYRWMAEFFGPGPRPPKGIAPPPKKADEKATAMPALLQLQSLSKKKIKRGPNGRYPDQVRETVEPVLMEDVPVGEVSERTGINTQTLYNWKEAAKKKAKSESRAVVVPNAEAPARVQPIKPKRVKYGELLTNEASKAMFASIDMTENLVQLKKIVDELDIAHRAGELELDYRDHRLMMVVKKMIGAPMRGARR